MNNDLTTYIKRYVDFSSEESELFQSHLKPIHVKKNAFLLEAGKRCKARYFIVKGCLRLFYIDNQGAEQIIHFGLDNWWISEYDSLINNSPSKIFVQAIENTELLALDQQSFEKLSVDLPKTNILFRVIMEKSFIASQRRIEYMLSFSGEELYLKFTSQNPQFLQRVPQYMIASYLGMTPEFYSKIRGKLR